MGKMRLPAALALAAILLPVAAFFILDAVFPLPKQAFFPPSARIVRDRTGVPLRFYLAADEAWRFPAALSQVSPLLRKTLVASEDRYFFSHPGVNPLSILRAAFSNLISGRVVSGASTISMQAARLADPKPRTLASKCSEAFRALQLERAFTKEEILEIYMNLAPFGGNIVGVGAASRLYFGKTPDRLSLGEAALLTVIPRSPAAFDPVRRPEAAKKARDLVLDQLAARGAILAAEAEEAKHSPLPRSRLRPPFLAPHFCDLAIRADARDMIVATTLDARLHKIALETVRGRMGELRSKGIANAAAVILDVKTRDILAMVGTEDFFDDARNGQINGALIARSPGSTLKPFLYAQAFDLGLIAPQSYLLDIPVSFAGYAPKNYDGLFRGRVTADEALSHSLNVPAVRLLDALGQSRFYELLRRGGLTTLSKPAPYYGLSLVLGGCEVTPLSLAALYAALASGGLYAPPRLLLENPAPEGIRLFSPEACRLTRDILTKVERPDLPLSWERARGVPAVAWKTGTSFGHRDAWAVGFSPEYVICVWVGNMDGTPVKGISGAVNAGPLLFDLFRAIGVEETGFPDDPLLDVGEIEVCAESHELPGPHCERTVKIRIIPGRTRLSRCSLHKAILVDKETGLRLLGQRCLETRPAVSAVIEDFPAELTAWRRAMGIPIAMPPALSPDCDPAASGQPPKITSPSPDTPYRLRQGVPAAFQRIALTADAAADAGTLYWYLDGELAAKGAPGDRLFLPLVPGKRRLAVVDGQGRMDAVTFNVE